MAKKIVLTGDMIIEEGLTYEEGCKAMQKASEHPKMLDWSFSLSGSSDKSGWVLVARYNPLVKDFLKNPEDYVIEIGE